MNSKKPLDGVKIGNDSPRTIDIRGLFDAPDEGRMVVRVWAPKNTPADASIAPPITQSVSPSRNPPEGYKRKVLSEYTTERVSKMNGDGEIETKERRIPRKQVEPDNDTDKWWYTDGYDSYDWEKFLDKYGDATKWWGTGVGMNTPREEDDIDGDFDRDDEDNCEYDNESEESEPGEDELISTPITPVFTKTPIVSLNRLSIEKSKAQKQAQKAEKNERKTMKFLPLRILVSLSRFMTLRMVLLHQRFALAVRKLENWWVDFEKKFSQQELFYLGISLPRTIKTPKDVLLYFPLLSLRTCAQLLDIRKNHLKSYKKIYWDR